MRDDVRAAEGTRDAVRLVEVAHDDARLQRLVQLYLHEWSALLPHKVELKADASFAVPDEFARHRAQLLVDDARLPLGFALTSRDQSGVAHVEEFFVVAGARRRGVGTQAACALFRERAGAWTFTVREENARALPFWRHVVAEMHDGDATEREERGDDGVLRVRFRFGVRFDRKLG